MSLYLHVPFCVKKCNYCDFLSGPSDERARQHYVELLCREIRAYGEYWGDFYEVQTVFIGGGTPTCLTGKDLFRIDEAWRQSFPWISPHLEYTVEANPGTVSPEHIAAFQKMKVTRISLGLQSAQDSELRTLGRIHTYTDFLKTYHELRDTGAFALNVDLMSAIPGQTRESYLDTLQKITALEPDHVSAYSLIVEPGTAFAQLEAEGMLELPSEETERQMYYDTARVLEQYGYQRYEISNYAHPGKQCRHNLVYWSMGEYLGLGLGASSFVQGARMSNPQEMTMYAGYVEQLESAFDDRRGIYGSYKISDHRAQMEEFMFLGLRKTEGVSRTEFLQRFGSSMEQIYAGVIPDLIVQGWLEYSPDRDLLRLTEKGIDVSNQIMAEFLLDP